MLSCLSPCLWPSFEGLVFFSCKGLCAQLTCSSSSSMYHISSVQPRLADLFMFHDTETYFLLLLMIGVIMALASW